MKVMNFRGKTPAVWVSKNLDGRKPPINLEHKSVLCYDFLRV